MREKIKKLRSSTNSNANAERKLNEIKTSLNSIKGLAGAYRGIDTQPGKATVIAKGQMIPMGSREMKLNDEKRMKLVLDARPEIIRSCREQGNGSYLCHEIYKFANSGSKVKV